MIFSLYAVLLPFVTGWALVRLTDSRRGREGYPLFLKVALAWGLGLGLFSGLSFLWYLLVGPPAPGLWWVEFILGGGTLLWTALQRKAPSSGPSSNPVRVPQIPAYRPLTLIFSLFLAYALGMSILLYLNHPHGDWDAWAIWNLRARFLFRGAEHWRDAFSPLLSYSHPDYPLLIPLTVARGWHVINRETTLVPGMIAMTFTFATVVLLVSAVGRASTRSQGYLAGTVLLGTPFFIFHGAAQYADVPLSFFYLAVFVLLYLADTDPQTGSGPLVLAGVMAGLAGWTKNEGLLFMLSIPLARLVFRRQGWRAYGKAMFFFGMGLLPVLLVILIFKIGLAPPAGLVGAQDLNAVLNKVTDGSRYYQILKTFGTTLYNFGYWPKISIIPLLILYALVAGFSPRRSGKSLGAPTASLCILLLGFFVIFLLSPHPLDWYLKATLGRLFLQLWPSILFIYFLLVNPPEDFFNMAASPFSAGEQVKTTGSPGCLPGIRTYFKSISGASKDRNPQPG